MGAAAHGSIVQTSKGFRAQEKRNDADSLPGLGRAMTVTSTDEGTAVNAMVGGTPYQQLEPETLSRPAGQPASELLSCTLAVPLADDNT